LEPFVFGGYYYYIIRRLPTVNRIGVIMKVNPFSMVIIPVLLLLLSSGCDSEKFFGYKYDAEILVQSAKLQGRVINMFTGEIVENARIEVNNQFTYSDERGNYQLVYILSDDEIRNKESTIEVSAENYHAFTISRLLNPEETIFLDFSLEYGAPIIEEIASPFLSLVQAIVFDYQGYGDIRSVTAHIDYVDSFNNIYAEFDIPLNFHGIENQFRAHYQIPVSSTMNQYVLSYLFAVSAIDRSGFSHRISHLNDPKHPDVLIFPE